MASWNILTGAARQMRRIVLHLCGVPSRVKRERLSRSWRCQAVMIAAIWYLLIPPAAGRTGVNTGAQLSDWSRAAVYNSETECRAAKSSSAAMFARAAGSHSAQGMLFIERSQCVASDDYRLEQPQSSPTPSILGRRRIQN